MLNKIIIILSIILISFSISIASPSYTGIYMFNEKGNNQNIDKVENLINNWFDINNILYKSDLKYYDKSENNESENNESENNESLKSYFEFDNSDKKLGSWKTKDPVMFYSLKSGNEYAMYWLEVPTQEGIFTTEYHLTNKHNIARELSHITFYTNNNVYNDNQVPEPSTSIMLMFGLLCLVGFYTRICTN